MSYTVAIVVPPVPADDRTAWAVLDGLIAEAGARPTVFQQVHDELTARFPCICSLPDDLVDDGVWSDGPLIDNFRHRAAVLGIVFSRVDEVLPVLVQAATSRGLTVFDWQTNHIHRGRA